MSLVERWWRRDPPSWEYEDLIPIAVLIGSSVGVDRFENEYSRNEAAGAVSLAPSSHLRDSCPTVVVPILGYHFKQASWWSSRNCEHWRHENEALWSAGWWERGHKVEVKKTPGRLGRYQVGAPLSRPSIYSECHPLRTDKQAAQQPSHRPFWHNEDLGANSQKVLLADATTKHRGLRQGLRHLLGFKNSLPQALRRSSIVACSSSLVEEPVNGLCYKPPNLSQLEKWQLRLDISHCWPAYENSIL